jgi:hypothetical protein
VAVAECVGAAAVVGALLGAEVTLRVAVGVAVCVGAAVAEWPGFGFGFDVVGFGFGFGFAGFDVVGFGFGFAGFDVVGFGFALFEAAGVARRVAVGFGFGFGFGFGDGVAFVGEEVGVTRAAKDALEGAVVDIPAAAEPVPATANAPEVAITSGIADTIAVFAARPFRPDPPVRRGGVWLAKLH